MSDLNAGKFMRNFFKVIVAALIIGSFIFLLVPFLIPIMLGGILAMAFSPSVRFAILRGHSRKLSLIALTIILFVAGVAPVTIVLIRGSKVVTNFISELSLVTTKHNIEDRVYAVLDNFSNINKINPTEVREKFDTFITSAGGYALKLFKNFMTAIPDVILFGFITILSFYFLLANEEFIRKFFDRYFYFSKANGDRFINLLKSSCKKVFFSNVVTAVVQASIVALGALIFNVGDTFIIFICTFFLSFIPVFGAGPFCFFLAIVAFLEQKFSAGIGMVVFSVISGVADNVVRPYLTSLGEVKVHPYISFLAIIGGVLLMGLPGLFVGPLLALLSFGAVPIILDDYFPERDQD